MKSSRNASARGCGIRIFLGCLLAAALDPVAALPGWAQAPPPAKSPLLVLLDGDVRQWQAWCAERGWNFLSPWAGITEKNIDLRVKALEKKVAEAQTRLPVDGARVYLAGQGDGATALFYVISREPDLWTAALALGGTPKPAIDTNRVYAANTSNAPLLWIVADKEQEELAKKLQAAGFNLETRQASAATPADVLNWLASHQRDAFPAGIDCETGGPTFARCYWILMTRFDPSERNDVLNSTRVQAGSGAVLDLGGFGFNSSAPGPGVMVSWLPDNYRGPLKMNDRIVAIAGKELKDARQYTQLMDQTVEEKPLVIMVERGKERVRLETRIVLPKREELVTARVQAKYLPDLSQVQIVSRAVTQMRVTIPDAWVPVTISWNGSELTKAEAGGCWLLDEQKELLKAKKCE